MEGTQTVILIFQTITALSFLLIGGFVYAKSRQDPINVSFGAFSLFLGLWATLGFIWNYQVQIGVLSDLTHRISMATIIFAGQSLLVFSWFFPSRRPWVKSRLISGGYVVALLVAALSFTAASVRVVEISEGRLVREIGPLYLVFALYVAGVGLTAITNLALSFRRLRFSVERQKVKYVLFGLLLSIPTALFFMLVLPFFGVQQLFFPGQISFLVFMGFAAMAIVRYRALDISQIALKILMWGITCSVVLVTIFIAVRFNREWLRESTDLQAALFGMILFAIVMIYFVKVKPVLETIIQPQVTNLSGTLDTISHELSHLRNLDELGVEIGKNLMLAFDASRVTVLSRNEVGKFSVLSGNLAQGLRALEEHDEFYRWLQKTNEVVEHAQVQINPEYNKIRSVALKFFAHVGAEIVVPLLFDQRLMGIVALGKKKNRQDYVGRDIELLAILRHDISMAFSNSRLFERVNSLYKEVKSSAETLERRVAERTAELETALHQLRRLDQLKSDFVATASHELRTPMTAVKGAIDMALELHEGGEREARLHHFLNMSDRNINRLIKLVNDLLDLSKLETGQMHLIFEPVSLASVFQPAAETVGPLLEKKQIKLENRLSSDLKKVVGDLDRLQQVAVNLLDNALKFSSPGGTIRVHAEEVGNKLRCTVEDEGGGIEPEHQNRIFDRFWREEDFARDREEGTGLGLAITKVIVELHEGKIWVESEMGRGSKFIFELPIFYIS